MSDSSPDPELRVRHLAPAEEVPVYNCLVFVRATAGGVEARVANLSGIAVSAASERHALETIVREFKSLVQQHLDSGEAIPWIESPQPDDDEQQRFIGVHL